MCGLKLGWCEMGHTTSREDLLKSGKAVGSYVASTVTPRSKVLEVA